MQKQQQLNSSSSEENNKLADLNVLLKENNFMMKADDQADFEIFMAKLQEKRRLAAGGDAGGLGGRQAESPRVPHAEKEEVVDLGQPKAGLWSA